MLTKKQINQTKKIYTQKCVKFFFHIYIHKHENIQIYRNACRKKKLCDNIKRYIKNTESIKICKMCTYVKM